MSLPKKRVPRPATVTRFCRTIGYPGYVELRVGIATDVGRNASLDLWTAEIGREFGPNDSPEDLLRMLISGHTKALREATSAIDLTSVTEVSRRIALSSHVDIYGVVGSAMLAELQGRLYRIGVPPTPGRRCTAASRVRPSRTRTPWQSGFRPPGEPTRRSRCSLRPVVLARSPWLSPTTTSLAELADRNIVTSIYEQFVQPDDLPAAGQLLVLDLLYLLVAQENFDRSSDKLAASALAVASHRRPRRTPPRATPLRRTPCTTTAPTAKGPSGDGERGCPRGERFRS